MRVDIDEAGSEDEAFRIEALARISGRQLTDACNLAVADSDIAGSRGSAGAVDDAGIYDDEVERRLLLRVASRQRQ